MTCNFLLSIVPLYLEIVEFLIRHGAKVNTELEELWRRIIFSICVKNTDDHLRNHGFLLNENGWRLSPAYDINPNEFGTGLSLNISEMDNSLDLELALSVAEYFRVPRAKAIKNIELVKSAVAEWRSIAKDVGLSKSEQDRMARAFE
jgi:serine/threonine-protein kinase HipA